LAIPKIQDLDVEPTPMIGLQPDVVAFQVAMNDPTLMGSIESQCDLIHDVEDFIRGGIGFFLRKSERFWPSRNSITR